MRKMLHTQHLDALSCVTGWSQRSARQPRLQPSVVCGSKKADAKNRLKSGRKRLAEVISELHEGTALDAAVLRQRLQQVLFRAHHADLG